MPEHSAPVCPGKGIKLVERPINVSLGQGMKLKTLRWRNALPPSSIPELFGENGTNLANESHVNILKGYTLMTFHTRPRICQHIWTFSPPGESSARDLISVLISAPWSVLIDDRVQNRYYYHLLRRLAAAFSTYTHARTRAHTHVTHICTYCTYFTGVENNALVFLITNERDERGPVSGGAGYSCKSSPAVTTVTLISRGDYLDARDQSWQGIRTRGRTDTRREGRECYPRRCRSERLVRAPFRPTCFHIRMKLIPFGKFRSRPVVESFYNAELLRGAHPDRVR